MFVPPLRGSSDTLIMTVSFVIGRGVFCCISFPLIEILISDRGMFSSCNIMFCVLV